MTVLGMQDSADTGGMDDGTIGDAEDSAAGTDEQPKKKFSLKDALDAAEDALP